jgi:hypothetical protein
MLPALIDIIYQIPFQTPELIVEAFPGRDEVEISER